MNLSKVKIESERLLLVSGNVDFAENIFLEYRDPVIKYMNYGPPESLEILKGRMKNRETEMKEGVQLFMAILLKETGEFIGCMALEDLQEENPEMGGWLKKSAHGHGYGREAAAALKQWAEEHLEYGHILWPCAVANKSSCKLAESLGGKVHREYEKTMARGTTWTFRDYWIPKNDEK
jgi:RimJ/RimL family protein N-acetyltransferase